MTTVVLGCGLHWAGGHLARVCRLVLYLIACSLPLALAIAGGAKLSASTLSFNAYSSVALGLTLLLTPPLIGSLLALPWAARSRPAPDCRLGPARIALATLNGLIGLLLLVAAIFLLGYYGVSGRSPTADTLLAVCQTNPGEALGYLQEFLPAKTLLTLLAITALALALLAWGAVADWRSTLHFASPRRYLLGLFTLLLALVVGGVVLRNTWSPSHLAYPTVVGLKRQLAQYRDFARLTARRRELVGSIQASAGDEGLFVLVIGESLNRTHMSAYGYERPTTPWLKSKRDDPHFVFMEQGHSNHTHTVPSLTFALTAKTQYDDKDFTHCPSLIEVARAAGYQVGWISNQQRFGPYDTPISVIANAADIKVFALDVRRQALTEFDEGLLKAVKDLGEFPAKTLLVLHLAGNHSPYRKHYPQDFSKFGKKERVDTYDNSVLYNDCVVEQIYDWAREQKGFQMMAYMPDHAEEVELGLGPGRGHNSDLFTWNMTKIPMWFAFSDDYLRRRVGAVTALRDNRQSWFTNDMLFDTMTGLMGIVSPDAEPRNDLSSVAFSHRPKDLLTLHGRVSFRDYHAAPSPDRRQVLLSKSWLHRVDSPGKMREFAGKYRGYELDVIYHERDDYFENAHDPSDPVIRLSETLAEYRGGGLWFDFKNLTTENMEAAQRRLSDEIARYDIAKSICYVESPCLDCLPFFRQNGWRVAYYSPLFDPNKASKARLSDFSRRALLAFQSEVDAVSLYWRQYPLVWAMSRAHDKDLLLWFQGSTIDEILMNDRQMAIVEDPLVAVILVKEYGSHHR